MPKANTKQSNAAVLIWGIVIGLGAAFGIWMSTDFHPFGLVAGLGIGNALVWLISFFGNTGKQFPSSGAKSETKKGYKDATNNTGGSGLASPKSKSSVPEFLPKPSMPLKDLPLYEQLIEETKVARTLLFDVARLETGEYGDDLKSMVANVDFIIAGVYSAPIKLPDVQRLFTYYLPEVSRLLKARGVMKKAAAFDRVAEIDAIIDRIAAAFQQLASRMHEADIRALDIDLMLLDQSLVAEFETTIRT